MKGVRQGKPGGAAGLGGHGHVVEGGAVKGRGGRELQGGGVGPRERAGNGGSNRERSFHRGAVHGLVEVDGERAHERQFVAGQRQGFDDARGERRQRRGRGAGGGRRRRRSP